MNINWFPGHMKKTRELLKENLKLVDVVFEILDSRIPISSKNPEIDKIIGDKLRITILNKYDLSNDEANQAWIKYYNDNNIAIVLVNATKGTGMNKVIKVTNEVMKEKMERLKSRGIKNKPIRAMIVGIPNVGKSTLINALAGKKSAKTGNRPGVTRGKQWIKLKGNLELLDTPGILWHKFEDQNVGLNLAFTGAIKDEIMDIETLSLKLIEKLQVNNKKALTDRYKIDVEEKTSLEILDEIARKRGCVIKKNEIDYERVAHIILYEFRSGMLGKISLEYPNDTSKTFL